MAVERGEARFGDEAEEADAGVGGGGAAEFGFLAAGAGDPEFGVEAVVEVGEEGVDAFEGFEPADVEEVGREGVGGRSRLGGRGFGDERGQEVEGAVEAPAAVGVDAELAEGEEGVDVAGGGGEFAGVPPELRGAVVGEGTGEAGGLGAGFAAVAEEDMSGADEPVFVRGVELDGVAVGEDLGAADEGDVVEMDDVEGLVEQAAEGAGEEGGAAGLLGGKGRQEAEAGGEGVEAEAGFGGGWRRVEAAAEGMEGVDAVDDVDAMAAGAEFACQALDEDGVAAEVAGRIKGGDEAEVKRPRMGGCRQGDPSPGVSAVDYGNTGRRG